MTCKHCNKELDEKSFVKVQEPKLNKEINKISFEMIYLCIPCWEKDLNNDSGSYTDRF